MFPEDISPNGHYIDELFYLASNLTGVTFLIVVCAMLYFLVRYRKGASPKAHYDHGNTRKALLVSVILGLFVFFCLDVTLAVFDHRAFNAMYGHPPKPSDAVVVQIFAKQFEWNFRLAGNDGQFGTEDDIASVALLTIPVDKDILLRMTSLDVVHSLFLPNLRMKQDVVPGLMISAYFHANKTTEQARRERGDPKFDYEIGCAELCGLGHYRMKARLRILSPEKFKEWSKKSSTEGAEFAPPEIWDSWPLPATPEPIARENAPANSLAQANAH